MLPAGMVVRSLADLGFEGDIEESADSLEGNALLKARFALEKFGFDCFADDTGLEVASLGGRPGVYSARYAGIQASFDDNIAKLLWEMKGMKDRSARFRTVIVSLIGGREGIFEGISEGHIAGERRGGGGFGYDAVFIPVGSEKTYAEMRADEKNAVSHRSIALKKFLAALAKVS